MFKRKGLILFFGLVSLALFLFLSFLQQQYVLPIAMYHSVSPSSSFKNRLSVPADSFERQMRFLKTHNYNVVTLKTIADLIKHKRRIPPKTIALTFDDGYQDNFTHAFPILKKYNLPATIFVIVNEIGRPQGDRLSWDEIRLMLESRLISIGSHGLGPEPLINIRDEEEVKKEIFDSKKILQERLGTDVEAFSYPEGRFNDKIKQLVKEVGYKLAVTTSPGKKFRDDDIFALKRLRISPSSNNLFVFWFETSGFYTFIKEHRDD